MRNLFLSGLLLPLKLYFQPLKFRAEIAALAPDLPDNYSLWRARFKRREAEFQYALRHLTVRALTSQLLPVFICLILQSLGIKITWLGMVFGVAVGLALGVVLGVTLSVAMGVAFGVVLGMSFGVVSGIAFDAAVSGSFGVAAGIAVGVAVGVATGVVGVVGGIVGGVASSVAWGVFGNLVERLVANVPGGVMDSGSFDPAGSAVGRIPASEASSGTWGLTWGAALGAMSFITATHALNFLIQFPQGLMSALVIRNAPRRSLVLWRVSPVRWDEVIVLPLPGLVTLLATLIREYPAEGQQALKEVAAHRYQRQAAHQVWARLAKEDAQQVRTLPALGAYERGLEWLSDEVVLPQDSRQALLKMRDISREVASAQDSDSATNRVRRLEAAQIALEALRANPGEFGAVLATWLQIVASALKSARQQQQIDEPIPQVYANDGKAIWPGNRRDEELPFKGRKSLITQLELALGGQAGERSTVLLYGQRRTGKTSMLLQLPRRLGSQFVPVFIDLQAGKFGAKDAAGLLSGLADTVADEALAKRNVNLPRLKREALAKDPYPAWDAWLTKVETTLNQRTLLICLDEFEALEEALAAGRIDERMLNMLRSMTQHRHSVCVLLSGSHQIDELPPHWAKALVGTSVLPISFLEEADARELITRPVKDFPDIYSGAAVDEVIRVTHCQPYYIQLLCALLVERMNRAHRLPPDSCVAVEDVTDIIPLALERGQNYFSDLWQNQIGSDAGRRILEYLAKSPDLRLSLSDIRTLVPDDVARRAAIDTLKRREIVKITDGGCHIIVPLVAAYVRQRTML